jgi:hypothetical protein
MFFWYRAGDVSGHVEYTRKTYLKLVVRGLIKFLATLGGSDQLELLVRNSQT